MRRLLLPLLALAFMAGLVTDASARSGSCLVPGNTVKCKIWTGKVTYVDDGDTFRVDLAGDRTRASLRIRITGIQAMERGQCHAGEATERLRALLRRGGYRVRLAALDPSSQSEGRWRRAVAVQLGGRWRDVGRILLAEGHALWLPNSAEWMWNAEYSRVAEQAEATHRNLWLPSYCGAGPSDASPLKLTVNSDANGTDADNVNGEWVEIRNMDPVNEVHLGGWWVRDSALHRYAFPAYTTIAPSDSLRLYVGRGTNTWTDFFWNSKRPIFDNISGHGMGDGAYLYDKQGDLRAWMTFPCRLACTDPNAGAIAISAHPKGREYVTLRNTSAAAVDLQDYRLESPPWGYSFGPSSVLAPGEDMTIEVRGDPTQDSPLYRFWGLGGAILNNGGDTVRLANYRGVRIGCYAYGSGRC
jgi:endonuclease YncB( thermonuclease family)